MNRALSTTRRQERKRNFLALVLLLGTIVAPGAVDVSRMPPPATRPVEFLQDIQPILENACYRCHGAERPKSGFSLVNRESALKGGDNGVAIIPGNSAASPLVHMVAGLIEDMVMPPQGKAEPLTAEQISLLRAWIDRGAQWPDTEPAQRVSVSPAARWVTVSGDERKFREHHWIKDGWSPGVEEFFLQENKTGRMRVTAEGRIFPLDEDYRVSVRYDVGELGFVHAGFEQHRRYFDDSGGFFAPFDEPLFSLGRDLHLDVGRAWIDFGLRRPDAPQLTVGYEYRYREGLRSTLQWGEVRTTSAPLLPDISGRRHIFPAVKEVDEKAHILKLDVRHDVVGVGIEDNFRAEFYDLNTRRVNPLSLTQGQTAPSRSVIVQESHNEWRAVNTLRLEKELRDWWMVSGGYLYSAADADAAFRQNTVHVTGIPIPGDFWNSQSLVFSQESHLFNANMRLGPWEGFTLSAGVQSEWQHQEGVGRVSLDTGNPSTFLLIQPATIDANLDRHIVKERAALRFTKIPYTQLFAEAALEQEIIGQFENQVGGGHHDFLRDTDASSDVQDYRAGFYSSPLSRVSLGGHYRNRAKRTGYDHRVDILEGLPGEGFPAFIRSRRLDAEEVEARLTLRPLNWLKTTITYQIVATDIDTETDSVTGVTPGGRLLAGNLDANVYGLNLVLTPLKRWYFSGTFNYYDSRAVTAQNGIASVAPYRGDIYSVQGAANFLLNEKIDLNANYSFSHTDYSQDNASAGLPVGIRYRQHTVQGGVTRRFKKVSSHLQYAFYNYSEPTARGFNDYTAHAVFATMTFRWR